MKDLLRSCRIVGVLALAIPAVLTAQTISDDFSTGTKWSGSWSTSGSGVTALANGRLEFSVVPRTTDDRDARYLAIATGSYTSDWSVQVDVHLALLNLSGVQYTNLSLAVVNSAHLLSPLYDASSMAATIDRYGDSSTGTVRGFESSVNSHYAGTNHELQVNFSHATSNNSTDAALRITFNSTTKELTSWYDADGPVGGHIWVPLQTVNIGPGSATWEMSAGSTFTIVLVGSAGAESGLSGRLSAGEAYFDNFLAAGLATPGGITTQPQSQVVTAGGNVTLTVAMNGSPTVQWQQNGNNVSGATSATLPLTNVVSANAGLYSAVATSGAVSTTSDPAIVGVTTTSEVIGAGTVLQPTHLQHPNGKYFDQILLTGTAETITAVPGQTARTSYIDLNDDIVQVEFSGAGSLSLVLDSVSGPAAPVNYNQSSVSYMRGHAGIVITGADETSNVSVFSVGRINANDPTGVFNLLLAVSATNNPANNGSSLFVGHSATAYDGVADIGFIAISSATGKFGGLRASNASCFATQGFTGIYAPDVAFTGPVFVSDISAADAATPVFVIGSSPDTRITGGDLRQGNGQPVKVAGLTQLKFTPGATSHNAALPAQINKAVLLQNGIDVTAQIVVNPQ